LRHWIKLQIPMAVVAITSIVVATRKEKTFIISTKGRNLSQTDRDIRLSHLPAGSMEKSRNF